MIKRIYFLLIIAFFVQTANTQEYFEINKILKNTITYNSLSEDRYGIEVFNLIGLDNNVSVHSIELNTKYRLFVRISRSNQNKITASISLTPVTIGGRTKLRKFTIETLLWPSHFTANLTLYNGKHKRNTLNISGPPSGKLIKIDLSDYLSSNIGDVSATITNIQFEYSEFKYNELQEISETISYYYSFGILLKDLIKEQMVGNHTVNQQVDKIFIDKIIIDRVISNIKLYDFKAKLNLRNNDPIDYIVLEKKLNRLSHRTTTLFNQQLLALNTDSLIPMNFCLSYCSTSSKYLNYANSLQPSDAPGFKDIAKIYDSQNAKDNLNKIDTFYSHEKYPKAVNISQKIFNEFVRLAGKNIADDNYTNALLLLNNALIIHRWFNTLLTSKYNSLVSYALDGVASSYLRVGDVALRAHNKSLASTYFNKADEIVISNEEIFESLQNTDTAFSNYLGLQYSIATQYIKDFKFNDALNRLSYGVNICAKLNKSYICISIDSAICLANSGLINVKLDSLERLITVGQFPDAYLQLDNANRFILAKSCRHEADRNRFLKLANSLFLEFLRNGEVLIEAQQPEMALYSLLKAKSIQINHLNTNLDRLDSLIKFAAEPQITTLIGDAKYHTWANRMDQATQLYNQAQQLNNNYFQGTNKRINVALEELSNQMASRKCISYKTKYSDIIKRAHIAIKYTNYDKLDKLFNEAQFYTTYDKNCNIDSIDLIELKNKYANVLQFYREYDIVINKLFAKGYEDVINKYAELLNFYYKNNLDEYNIVIPDIKVFIKSQNLLNLTRATANYHLENKEYMKGLEYIDIYKNQGGDAKKIKHISNAIAKNLAIKDVEINKSAKDALHEYTVGDSWYNSFKIAYLKNRLIN